MMRRVRIAADLGAHLLKESDLLLARLVKMTKATRHARRCAVGIDGHVSSGPGLAYLLRFLDKDTNALHDIVDEMNGLKALMRGHADGGSQIVTGAKRLRRRRRISPAQFGSVFALIDTSGGEHACWPWRGGTSHGYGVIRVGRRMALVHHVIYELTNGELPAGLQVDHTCHNADPSCPGGTCDHRRCVNPRHLRATTRKDNILAGQSPSAINARKTECVNGHQLVMVRGRRACPICMRASARRSAAKHRRWTTPEYKAKQKIRDHARWVRMTDEQRAAHNEQRRASYARAGEQWM